MTCPAGCVRPEGHAGFHTTIVAIAAKETLQAEADAKTAIFSLRSLYEMLEAEQPFPCPLIFGPDGSIWFSTPTIHGRSRTTYQRLA